MQFLYRVYERHEHLITPCHTQNNRTFLQTFLTRSPRRKYFNMTQRNRSSYTETLERNSPADQSEIETFALLVWNVFIEAPLWRHCWHRDFKMLNCTEHRLKLAVPFQEPPCGTHYCCGIRKLYIPDFFKALSGILLQAASKVKLKKMYKKNYSGL